VTGIGDLFHPGKLPHQPGRSHSVTVTAPRFYPYLCVFLDLSNNEELPHHVSDRESLKAEYQNGSMSPRSFHSPILMAKQRASMVKQSIIGFGRSDPNTRHLATGSRIFRELVHTRAFQRLENIRFLGGIDYLLIRAPNGAGGNIRHNRFEHSVGVAWLALLYSDTVELPNRERDLLTAAALLHDIGHAPLSHSLEPVFLEEFGIDHHSATESIILGESPLGTDVNEVLRQHSINVSRLLNLIRGEESSFHLFMAGPINFDTIEGILRSSIYFRPKPNFPKPEAVLDAAIRRTGDDDRAVVDQFWLAKDYVYQHLINSDYGILADYVCKAYLRQNLNDSRKENRVNADDYFSTEADLFKKLFGLRKILTDPNFDSLTVPQLSEPIPYKNRRFFVQRDADFFSRDDFKRYRQTKELLKFGPQASQRAEFEQDLFDGCYPKG